MAGSKGYRPGMDRRSRQQRTGRAGQIRPRADNWSAVAQSYAVPGIAIVPLRAFLGITFIYAALQKLSDPGFFKQGSPTYIGTQIIEFMRGSPIRIILQHAAEHAVLAGGLVIVGELGIGLLILAGLFTRLAALAGLSINLMFFLSASWNVYPYFLGSDIVFVMAWLTLVLTGPGAFALDGLVPRLLNPPGREGQPDETWRKAGRLIFGPGPAESYGSDSTVAPQVSAQASSALSGKATRPSRPFRSFTRREAVIGTIVTFALFVLGLAPRNRLSGGVVAAPGSTPQPGSPSTPTPSPRPGSGSGFTPPTGSQKVGNIHQVKTNSAINTTDPSTGDPALVVHTASGQFAAYDAVCTHAGCTCEYYPPYKMIVCPCHGSIFDPEKNAQVVQGPAFSPLTKLTVAVDETTGDIYLV